MPPKGHLDEDLVDVVEWEFLHGMPLVHNGPFDEAGRNSDESGLFSNLEGGWIENVWQRVVEGKERFDDDTAPAYDLYKVETDYFRYPKFNTTSQGEHPPNINPPTWDEANGRLLYVTGNVWKKSIGSSIFGDALYVLNPAVRDRMLIASVDTGKYSVKP
eukprot:gene10742-10034_t